MSAWRGWRFSWIAGAALLGACSQGAVPEPEAVQKRLELQAFGTCEQLETYIEDTAVLDMRTQLESAKTGNYGWGWGRGDVFAGAPEASNDASAGAAAPQSQGPNDYTTTNTQVAGVDEADFVKNDGTRIFVLSGNRLYINKSWPAEQLANASSLEIEGWPREMFLDENNRVVVFSTVWHPYPFDNDRGAVWCDAMWCGYYYANTVKVTVIDVADLANPRVTQEYHLPGHYENSRRVGSAVRIVLNDAFRWPKTVRWYPEDSSGTLYNDKTRLAKAYDQLMATNEQAIRAAALTDWLPLSKRRDEHGNWVDVPYNCSDFHRSNAPTKLGLVTVATLNLATPDQPPARTSIVAESGEVYASAQHLYVASRHWWWWPELGQADHTYLHKFDISQPDRAVYVGSGGVDGHIIDQFSMDEDSRGYFRVATTINTRVEDTENPGNTWGRMETKSRVSVLGESNGTLALIGQTEDLAPGEQVFSSRFVEEKGFVVTFRQVDPLFTIDLSDPQNPRKVGELKIPGFSTYIHPLDANHLLTIGEDRDANGGWSSRAVKLTIFDVTDMTQPREAFTQTIGSTYGYSEAQHEHKAFNYFPAKKLLAIPFWDYNPGYNGNYWDYFTSDLRVFHVDTATGITPRGSISMKDVYMRYGNSGYAWDYYWSPMVRRSVMADDYVYAISDGGIRVANLNNLSQPLATVDFVRANPNP